MSPHARQRLLRLACCPRPLAPRCFGSLLPKPPPPLSSRAKRGLPRAKSRGICSQGAGPAPPQRTGPVVDPKGEGEESRGEGLPPLPNRPEPGQSPQSPSRNAPSATSGRRAVKPPASPAPLPPACQRSSRPRWSCLSGRGGRICPSRGRTSSRARLTARC